ncbi:hypothetical protein [Spiroplasma sp. SV19]|uniref:DUF7226 domain-containing protein n=1 Tax=Spiroplasma sp. SV19 TaxID=2570468 RepID=UPI0024B803FD|nr:hypothetical protein [Spiroplasma sp. SV19]WHQ37386.1 hypothetical protein E7Y35_05935 [Spiroplasma sp. SV19]
MSSNAVEKENINIIFPQADDLNKIYDLLISIEIRPMLYRDVSENIESLVSERQWDYYANALYFLELAEKWKYNKNNMIFLSNLGQKILDLKNKQEFYKIVKEKLISLNLFTLDDLILEKNIKKYNIRSNNTIKRRIQTIKAWIKTINENLGEE